MYRIGLVTFICAIALPTAIAIRCWHCSSDVDYTCKDPFNGSDVFGSRRGGGAYYDNYNQGGYNQGGYNQGGYNSNYQGQNYNPNSNYQRGGYQNFQNSGPRIQECNEDEARLRRMKNVCLKKITKSPNGITNVIRRCEMVNHDTYIGSCYDPVSRGMTLEACEYCDYDGCNSATSLTVSILAMFLPLIAFLYH